MHIRFFIALLFTLFCGCSNTPNAQGSITIKNDILDKEFNSFSVDQILTSRGIISYRVTLRPGESVKLPFSKISQLRFTRRYDDHTNVYLVTCPEKLLDDVTMKLIDVHTNRLSGGCELQKRGTMGKGGLIKWE